VQDNRAALVAALAGIDRLVLLGDVIELRRGPLQAAIEAARPVLADLGKALAPGGEVVLVPGNHDHHLLNRWFERRREPEPPKSLGLERPVGWQPGDPLAAVADALAPATVRVAYPGVWLRADVYALHGHYLDVHTTVPMLERLAAGAMARAVRRLPDGPRSSEDYEALLAPVYAWIDAVAQTGGPPLARSSHGASAGAWRSLQRRGSGLRMRQRAIATAFAILIALLNRAGIGPLRRNLSGEELRRAALLALAEVLERLAIDAEHVIFGHTHRAGPLSGDELSAWRGAGGQRLLNTGSWVYEPAFLGANPQTSPYRPGFAVRLDDGTAPPQLTNLLDRKTPALGRA